MAGKDEEAGDKPVKTAPPADNPADRTEDQQPADGSGDGGQDEAARLDAVIGAWIADQINDSPVSRDTAAFNHLTQVALPALRQAILGGE